MSICVQSWLNNHEDHTKTSYTDVIHPGYKAITKFRQKKRGI